MRPHAVGARGKGDKPAVPCPPASRSCCPMASAPCPKPGRGGKSQHLACWELHFPSLQPFPAAVPPPRACQVVGCREQPCPSCCCLPRGVLGLFHQAARRAACPGHAAHTGAGAGGSASPGAAFGVGKKGVAASAPRMLCMPSAPFPWLWPRVRLLLFPLLFTLCSRPHPRAPEPGQPAMRRAFLPLFSANQKQKKKEKKK